MIEKPKRIENRELLDKYKKYKCAICGKGPCDPCHIKTVGSGGHDEDWNLLAMCREHHTMQHSIGFWKLCSLYPFLRQTLAQKGWIFDGNKKLRRA